MIMMLGAWLTRARRAAAMAAAPLAMVLLVTAAVPAAAQTYTIITIPNTGPQVVVTGPDGALWFSEGVGHIGRSTTGGTVTQYPAYEPTWGITVGPDGALWVSEDYHIERFTTAGTRTTYTTPGNGGGPITSWQGELWYGTGAGGIQPVSTSGVFGAKGYVTPDGEVESFVVGSDGALWFVESDANKVGRITTSGGITTYTLPNASSYPHQITAGPDGASGRS